MAVVIITRDRPDDLFRTLGHLTAMTEKPAVIVVDNGSAGDYLPVLRSRFPGVTVVPLPANAAAAARTVGIRVAAREYVAFSDDDSWWEDGALERAVEVMEGDPRIGLVAGRVVVQPSGRLDPTSATMRDGALGPDLLPSGSGGLRAAVGCMACGAVVRSRAYLSVGGFRAEMGVGGEEQLLVWDLWSAGWRVVYDDGLVAHHQPSPSRDPAGRRAVLTRNDLWAAWARLPARAAVARTLSVMGRGEAPVGAVARGTARAVRRADWPLARRARLPKEVESARHLLEA